jgi:hypothetical protein
VIFVGSLDTDPNFSLLHLLKEFITCCKVFAISPRLLLASPDSYLEILRAGLVLCPFSAFNKIGQ